VPVGRDQRVVKLTRLGWMLVAGAVVIVVVLLVFPILVGIGAVFLAAVLGGLLNADQAKRFEGTELAELNQ
jgi:hypothetical protein